MSLEQGGIGRNNLLESIIGKDQFTPYELQEIYNLTNDDDFLCKSSNKIGDDFILSYDEILSLLNHQPALKQKAIIINNEESNRVAKRIKLEDDVSCISAMTSIPPSVSINQSNSNTILINNIRVPKSSRIPYLMEYMKRQESLFNSLDCEGLAKLVQDVFTPDGTFMTPELKFVSAIKCIPMVIKSLLLCIPDHIIYVKPCELVHPRVIKCQCFSSGTLVGSDSKDALWNQTKYISSFANESVLKAKVIMEEARRNHHVVMFGNVMNVLLVLNEEGTHIVRQMNILQNIEVTSTISKQIYLD